MKKSDVISGLNDLLTKNYDAEQGYRECRESSNSVVLKALYNHKISQRYHFGHDLKNMIKDLGGTPDKGGSIKGALHRTWIDFKSMMSQDEEETILDEIQRGEEDALNEYNEFLKEHELPQDIRSRVSRQRNEIAHSLDRADILEEVYS